MTAGPVRTIPVTTRRAPGGIGPHELVDLARRGLPSMLRPSGLFCFEVDQGDPSPGEVLAGPALRGESVRYSIIVVLGALRHERSVGAAAVDVERHLAAVQRYRPALGPGDLGLLLWAESRCGTSEAASTLAALDRCTDEQLDGLVGMELAWVVLGAVAALTSGHRARVLLDRSTAVLDRRTEGDGTLLAHRSTGRSLGPAWRSRFPNFATEVYALLALVELARHGLAADALDRARRLADLLIGSRLPDGGWPWLFDTHGEQVVEPYEVYSVHQDAMAPMALLPLADLTGDHRYRQAAHEGLGWLTGRNVLGVPLVDRERRIVHRSIRRRVASARMHLVVNTAASSLGLRARLDGADFEIDRTCRPYHLGWILEAWSPTVSRTPAGNGEVGS